MNVPGMRRAVLAGGGVHVWSNSKRLVLQVRVKGPEDDPLATWAKAGVELDAAAAVAVAGELLRAAAVLMKDSGEQSA